MTAAAPASDRLGSMAGSQVTAGLRGSVVRESELTRVQPQVEGQVHITEKRVARLTCALDATTRW
jgi:hypothetical protein